MGIATQYEGGLKFDGDQMYITTSGGTTLLTLGNTGSANFVGAITTPNLFLGDSSVRLSPGTNGEVGINYNTSATGSLVWYAGGTASKFNVTNAGNATFAGTIGATNFSGSSSGTNTGDQTLPTLSSLGALSTTGKAADSHLLDGIDSSAFLRSNAADSFDGTLSWGGSAGSDAFDLNNSDIEDVRGIRAREFTQIASGVPRNNLGSPTVTEMALFDPQFRCMTDLSNNYNDLTDLTFYKQMTDSSEWEEVTYSDDQKRRFLRTNNSSVVIPNTAYKFRVEFNAPGYVFANAIYFYWSSQSHSTKVHIWKQRSDNDTWYQHTSADDNVSSWPGHLWMPFNTIPWHETASTTSHYHKVRVEFTPSWSTGTYSDRDIALSGGQIWGGYPSGRRTPHYYDQNGKLITWGDFEVNGKLNIDTRDTNTTSTTALVMNGNEVEQRTLGSNAFNSTSYITSQRAISSTPTDGATTTAISSDWAFDNVKTAVPANAVFTDTVNTFDGAYSSLSSIPSTFAPSAHSHGIGGITDASRWWNNFGDNHTTRTAFDAEDDSLTTGFGWRYVQGSTSGPGTSTSPNQFYALTVGLGNDYDYDNYAMQLVIPRNTSTPYISVRFEEGGSLGSWQKISAGYADSAGSIAYSNVSGTPTLGTAAAAATTDFATAAQGTLADSALQSLPSHNHDDRYFRRYKGQASSISSTAYRTAFTVAGGNLASSIRFSVQGTTGNVVVSNVIDVIANHSQDILIEATSGVYTRLYVKVVSDSNEDFAIELKTNSANAVTLDIEVLAYGNETVTFTTSHSFTGTSLELDCEPGKTFKATGGDSGDIKTYGVFKGDGSGLTGITKAATVSDQASPTADIQIGVGTSNTGNRSDVALLGATNAGGVVNALGLLNTATGANSNGVALNFHNGSNYSPTGQIIVQQNSSGTASHSAMKFFTYGSSNLTHQMSIKSDGVVRFLSYGTGILSTDTNGNISAISDGTSGQVLTTNGSGGFSFTTVTSGSSYTLPTASDDVLGGIKVGDNLTITEGVLSATDTDTVYTHPTGDGNNHIPTGGAAGQFLKYSSSGAATWATPSYTTNTDTVYTHPTSAGNKHIPTGGAAGQFLKYSSSGTATWATPSYTTNTNTTYSAGTGLELSGTTFKLNGGEIAASVNLNTMRSTGIFAQNSNNDTTSGSNWPTNNAGILEVWNDDYGNGLHCTQRYSRYNTTDVYQRNYYNGTWTSWRNLTQDTNTNTTYSAGGGLDLTSTTFSVEPDLRDGITHVGKDANNYIQFDSTNGRIDFYAGGVFVARMESDGDLHMKGDVIAFSDIF